MLIESTGVYERIFDIYKDAFYRRVGRNMLIESTGVYDRIFDIYKDALHLIDTIDRTNDLQTIRAHALACKDNISDYLYALESLPFDEDET